MSRSAVREQTILERIRAFTRTQTGIDFISQTVQYILLILGAILIMIPFLWMISTSFKSSFQVWDPDSWWPDPFVLDNYRRPFEVLPMKTFFKNTMITVIAAVIGVPLSSSLVAYGFARYQAPGSTLLFILLLGTMMLPGQVTLIPTFILYRKLGWYDTLLPLTVPCFLASPFYVFLLRQFYAGISKDVEEAAIIDGCGTLRLWWQVLLPMTKPALATVVIFEFLGKWNDFFGPLIYLETLEKFTLALGMRMFQTQFTIEYGPMMALATLLMLPCVLLFFFCSRYFIQGINLTGSKG